MINRKLAGLAAGALGASVLAAPALTGVANAAVVSTDLGVSIVCEGASSGYAVRATIEQDLAVSVDKSAVTVGSATLSKLQKVTVEDGEEVVEDFADTDTTTFRIEGVTTVLDLNVDGEAVAATSTREVAAGAGTATNVATTLPAFAGTRFQTGDPASITVTGASVSFMLHVRPPFPPGGVRQEMALDCEVEESEQFGPVAGPIAAPAGGALYKCDIPDFGARMYLPTPVTVTAQAKGSNVEATVAIQDIPIKTVPVPLENTPITGTATGTIDGKAASFTGTRTVNIPKNTDIPVPAVTGSVVSSAKTVDVELGDLTFLAKHPLMDVSVTCELVEPVTITGVAVAAEPIVTPPAPTPGDTQAPAVAAKTATKVSSAKVKGGKVTVKATVKAGKTNASGKVKIVIKKGKKTVQTKTVSLKKGAVSFKSKKLKKGAHQVTVSFAGTKDFAKSSGTKKFTVK